MFRVNGPTASPTRPTTEKEAGAEGWFHEGDPTTGKPTTIVDSRILNTLQAELENAVLDADLSPSIDDDAQLSKAVQELAGRQTANVLANGSCQIDQRREGVYSAPLNNFEQVGVCDRIVAIKNLSGGGTYRVQQASGFAGFEFCARAEVATPESTIVGTDFAIPFRYIIELRDLQALFDKPMTVSFYVQSNVIGKFTAGFLNNDPINDPGTSNGYVHQFEITQANTPHRISITFPKFQRAWFTGNQSSQGVHLYVGGLSYGDYAVPPSQLGQVVAGLKASATDNINWMSAAGNYIEMTGLQFEVGKRASAFNFIPYSIDLLRCQRYLEVIPTLKFSGYTTASQKATFSYALKVSKRITPTVSVGSINYTASGASDAAVVPDGRSAIHITSPTPNVNNFYDLTINNIVVNSDFF